METETENKINFLDIMIQKERDNLSFNIFRKPTATDTIIPRDSCHPPEHKHAAIRYLINRTNTYDLNEYNKKAEHGTIKHILKKNSYDASVIKQLSKTKPKVKHNKNKNLWAKFTYVGRETKFIPKLFKESSVKVTYTTNNTISKCLSMKPNHPQTQNQYKNVVFTSLPVLIATSSILARQTDLSTCASKNIFEISNTIITNPNLRHTCLKTSTLQATLMILWKYSTRLTKAD
jgi:hypothetical protein